jgi:hypothetical protein
MDQGHLALDCFLADLACFPDLEIITILRTQEKIDSPMAAHVQRQAAGLQADSKQ